MEFLNLIFEPLKEVFLKFKAFLPNLLAMLVILIIGIIVARLVRLFIVRVLKAVNFDSWSDRMGVTAIMRKGDLWSKPSIALGAIAYWVLIIVTVMAGLSALKIDAVDRLVAQFFAYLPRVFSAILILLVGYAGAGFAGRAVLILAMVLEQLQVAPGIVLAAFSIIFGGIVVALAIAFGMGGIDAAKRMIEKETGEKKDGSEKDIEHL